MNRTSHIGWVLAAAVVALGVLGTPGAGIAADATKPTYNNYRPSQRGPNDNDYHAKYHADYSATQDGRPAQPKNAEDRVDPREDSRRFQDRERAIRSPYSWRRY